MQHNDQNSDRIIVQNMRFNGKHGVTGEERSAAQGFGVDVELVRNLQIAGHSDAISNTVDYSEIYAIAKEVVEVESFHLVESIAENISRRIFDRFAFDELLIRVWKNNPPLGGPVDYAGVQIHRTRPPETKVYLSLGSNVGDREENLFRALALLDDATPKARITKVSPIYETEPVGNPNQGWFLNIAVEVETELPPTTFHELTRAIEEQLNVQPKVKWNPRVIDIDIILCGAREFTSNGLTIPHPYMAERAFVLRPLSDIAPDARHPSGVRVSDLLSSLSHHEEVRLYKR